MDNQQFQSDLVKELARDRKADRRWRNIRFFIGLIIIVGYVSLIFFHRSNVPTSPGFDGSKPYVSLIRMNGPIMAGKSFSAANMLPALDKAFADPQARGVILDINSPGGSPVQAATIFDQIRYLEKKYPKLNVDVVGGDALASGSYLVASSADKIFVNGATLTGSIGVIMSGFGLTDAIHKLGISRRVFTAGTNKDRLDMFAPLKPQDITKVNSVLNNVHQQFIHYVEIGRKGRLHGGPKLLFSGDFWTGQQALKLGLVDGLGDTTSVMRQQFHTTQYKDYTPRRSFFQSLAGGIGAELDLALGLNRSTKLQAEL